MWEFKGGSGLWNEYINSQTKESSIKEHKLKSVKKFCKHNNHYFVPTSPSSRELTCRKCGIGANYILGIHKLVNGKIISIQG